MPDPVQVAIKQEAATRESNETLAAILASLKRIEAAVGARAEPESHTIAIDSTAAEDAISEADAKLAVLADFAARAPSNTGPVEELKPAEMPTVPSTSPKTKGK